MQLSDEQKWAARSMRYVDAARVVRLDDGTFIIYTMTSGAEVGATQDPAELSYLVGEACRTSGAYWEAAHRAELAHRDEVQARARPGAPPAVQLAAVNLEDLDL